MRSAENKKVTLKMLCNKRLRKGEQNRYTPQDVKIWLSARFNLYQISSSHLPLNKPSECAALNSPNFSNHLTYTKQYDILPQ